MEKGIMAAMTAIVMIAVLAQVVYAFQPAPPQYCCPLETGVCFYTYDELYSHFTSAHPSEPINIIWE